MKKLGLVGLGKMGGNMARRLARAGIELTVFDRSASLAASVAAETGARAASELTALVEALPAPRAIWVMVPAGEATQATLDELVALLAPGDVVIDGGNALYKESQARAAKFAQHGVAFLDVGVSGGVWGEKNGYALMIGGDRKAAAKVEPIFRALAPTPDDGWLYCGPSGAGHYVKMVHNGIEYGMMQAFAEGLSLLQHKPSLELDLGAITEMWRHGSVVRSWLLDLIAQFLAKDGAAQSVAPFVADSGEGRWTVQEGVELGVPTPVIAQALYARFSSQGKDDFGSQLLALMRQGFGGHAVKDSAASSR